MKLFRLRLPLSAPGTPAAPTRARAWARRVAMALLAGLGAALLTEVGRVLFAGNVHEVMPGRLYRSAQLSPSKLRDLIRSRGIRTVVNLRGCCAGFDWYAEQCRVTHELNVAQEDVTLSANRLPAPSELRRLIEVYDHAEYPILIHCRQGADRTGLAATVYLLLHSTADLPTARRQCSPRYAHFDVLSTANMGRFFDMYEDRLARRGETHSPERFRRWALHEYRPDPAPARLEFLHEVNWARVGESPTLRIRATNISNVAWGFTPGSATGMNVRYVVADPSGRNEVYRAARIERSVAPGESIDVDLPVPRFRQAGLYRLSADLADRHLSFSQLGSEPLETEIMVVEHQGR